MTVAARVLSKGVYAKSGEESCCENGHPLARFLRDVTVGAPVLNADIEMLNGMTLATHVCPVCGGKVMASPGVYYFKA